MSTTLVKILDIETKYSPYSWRIRPSYSPWFFINEWKTVLQSHDIKFKVGNNESDIFISEEDAKFVALILDSENARQNALFSKRLTLRRV